VSFEWPPGHFWVGGSLEWFARSLDDLNNF
jgi:hypothetical protein